MGMLRISTVLAIAALASGCGKDKPKDPSPAAEAAAEKPTEKPVEPPPQAAKPPEDKAPAQAVNDPIASWRIDVGRAGPVSAGMSLDALRKLPGITLKTVTEQNAIEIEDEEEMATEDQERIQVWVDGEHQLTLIYAMLAKSDKPGYDKDNFEDQVTDIMVYGRLPRVAPIANESPAGVGTTAAELQDRYGAPTAFERDPWTPGICATFAKQPAVTFCFDTKLKTFAKVVEKKLAVTAMQVRN
jgi:hypothetical protein